MAWFAKFDGVDGSSGHTGGANFAMCDGSVRFLGDGSVRPTDTSAVATLMDLDFPGDTHDDGLLLPAVQTDGGEASPEWRTDGVFTVALPLIPTSDGEYVLTGTQYRAEANGDNYSGSHVLYQDVNIPHTDDGLLLPAVQDDGLLLPALQMDHGLLLPY